jgi:hypothetical protein
MNFGSFKRNGVLSHASKNKELKELKNSAASKAPVTEIKSNVGDEVVTTKILSSTEMPKSVPLIMVESD